MTRERDRQADGDGGSAERPPAPREVAAVVRSYWPWRYLAVVFAVLVVAIIAALANAIVTGG